VSVCAALHVAGEAQGQNRPSLGEGLAERIQDLHLTDAQEARIAGLRKEYRPKVEAVVKELVTLVKDEVAKAEAVLSPEQRTKL
jgi:hypothetical protein